MSTDGELWLKRASRLQSEEEWRNCDFFYPHIRLIDRSRVGDRKLRLFTAACVSRLRSGPYLGDQEWVAEALVRQADAPPTAARARQVAAALREVRLRCTEVMGGMYWQASIDYSDEPETDPWRVAFGTADATIIAAARRIRVAAGLPDERPEDEHRADEERALSDLVKCIFGNPFRPAQLDPAWLTSTVIALARGIYQDGKFDRMPILADALMDAGCDTEDILAHCRSEVTHVCGCWVMDLILGLA